MSRFSDCIALTKPHVTWMVVATGAVGMYLAKGPADWRLRMVFLLGTVMLVSGANAMNMYLERDIDGRAERTRNRPLPAGRLPPWTALVLGLGLGTSSVVWLALCVNLLTAVLGLLAFLSYTALYTPLKQRSAGALVIGAIPGAMPPLMGWTAITNRLDLIGLTLFAIMFLWQLPHFIAIALFRYDDYRKAGFKTLVSEMGVATAKFQVVLYLLLLCPVALVLVPLGVGGKLYLWIAFVSGIGFLVVGVQGLRTSEDGRWAKRLFKVSLLYLTVVFGAMLAGQAVQGDDAVPMFVARHNPG